MASINLANITLRFKVGTEESGHWGHYGRQGLVGGSRPGRGHRRGAPPIEVYAQESQWVYSDYQLSEMAATADELRRSIRGDRVLIMQRWLRRGYSQEEARQRTREELDYANTRLRGLRVDIEARIDELINRGDVPNDLWYVDGAPDRYNQLASFGQRGSSDGPHDTEQYANDVAPDIQNLEQDINDLRNIQQIQTQPTVITAPHIATQPQEVQNKVVAFMQDWSSIPATISDEQVSLDTYGASEAQLQEYTRKFGFSPEDLKKMAYVQGMHSRITINEEGSNGLGIRVYITDPNNDNADIGYFNYTLYASGGKPDSFHADYLKISESYRDKNIGGVLVMRHAMQAKFAGYKTMEFLANISIGKYAWAKEGAEFKTSSMIRIARQKMKEYAAEQYYNFERKGVHIEPGYEAAIDRLNTAHDIATFSWPGFTWKGSEINNEDVDQNMTLHFGKAFLLDDIYGLGSWQAVVDLTQLGGF